MVESILFGGWEIWFSLAEADYQSAAG